MEAETSYKGGARTHCQGMQGMVIGKATAEVEIGFAKKIE